MSKRAENRPDIVTVTTGAELKRWYWLKSELAAHAKVSGLPTTGGKFDILERIAYFLDTGNRSHPQDKTAKPKSKFDWHSAELTPDTVITDSYKNSQYVRRFFKSQVDDSFKFNNQFMTWMRDNTGLTLKDAVAAYQAQKEEAAKPGYQSDIAHHNQFNQYTRDFLADNPVYFL